MVSSARISALRHPERAEARRQVHLAVKRGDLKPLPCQVCGIEPTEAHHADYSKPLEVQWLCKPHHREIDPKRGKKLDKTPVNYQPTDMSEYGAILGSAGGRARAKKFGEGK